MTENVVPSSWIKVDIENVCEKVTDGSHNPPKASTKGRPMLSAKNIFNGKIYFDVSHRLIEKESFDREDSRTKISPNDILLTVVGTLGRVALVPHNTPCFTLQRSVAVLSAPKLNPQYFRYSIEAPNFQKQIFENAKGTAQKGIYLKKLRGLQLYLPSLAEQKQIAAKLDELLAQVDTLKTRLDTIPTILKRFRQSVLASAVNGKLTGEWRSKNDFKTDVSKLKNNKEILINEKKIKKDLSYRDALAWFEIPNDWEFVELQSFASKITDGEHKTPKRELSGRYLLSARNVRDGYIDLTKVDYVGEEEFIKLRKRCDPNKGDILISCSGSVGRVTLVDNSDEYVMVRSAALVKTLNEYIDNYYLMYTLQSPFLQEQIVEKSKSTAQSNLFLGQIKELGIPYPPILEQAEIIRCVKQLFDFSDQIQKQVNNAQAKVNNLTQSILAKAFRGELTEEWRKLNPELICGENSAEVLLEKIKVERELLTPKKRTTRKKTG